MVTSKQLLLVSTITAVPCVIWIITSYSPANDVYVQIPKPFQQPPEPATMVGVKKVHQPVKTSSTFSLQEKISSILDTQVMNTLKRFVFFIGSGRSGHSIVGSLLDAHPHMIIAHEYYVFKNWKQFYSTNQNWTKTLFQLLYRSSIEAESDIRQSRSKGYSLAVNNLWQGKFNRYVEVIGDKNGGMVNHVYMNNKSLFQIHLKILQNKLLVPIHVIHVIRNPFDMIATQALYKYCKDVACVAKFKKTNKVNQSLPKSQKFMNDFGAKQSTKTLFRVHQASLELTELLGRMNVLDVHSIDFINDPRATLTRIFEFLGVDASEHYLQVCVDKVFKSISRTRELMIWPPSLKHIVEENIKNYGFLSRYNFTSN